MDNIIKKIKNLFDKGFFHILLGGSLTKIIAFMSSIAVVRLLTKEEYAFLAYTDNIYAYILLICGLGTSSAILKFCTSDNSKKDTAFLSYAFKFGTIFQICLTIMIPIALSFITVAFDETRTYISILIFYPLLYFWVGLLQSFMRTQYKNKQYAYAGILQSIVVLLFSVIFAALWGVSGIIGARYIALIIVLFYCYKVIRQDINKEKYLLSKDEKKSFISLAIALLIANVFSMIMPINENFLINNIIQSEEITANFKVASLIPSQLPFFTTAIITYYFPIFARMKNEEEIWKQSKNIGKVTLLIIGIISIVGIIISPLIIKIVYGNQYNGIDNLMTILWIINAINAGFRMLPMNILPAIGYAKFNMILSIVTCAFHFIMDYFFITHFGINGAVIAGGISYLVSGVAYWIYLKMKCGGKNVLHY